VIRAFGAHCQERTSQAVGRTVFAGQVHPTARQARLMLFVPSPLRTRRGPSWRPTKRLWRPTLRRGERDGCKDAVQHGSQLLRAGRRARRICRRRAIASVGQLQLRADRLAVGDKLVVDLDCHARLLADDGSGKRKPRGACGLFERAAGDAADEAVEE
jgi:hypothetical protein